MVSININDFFEKAASCRTLSRDEEIACAIRMKNGDPAAREQLIQSYTPMVASHIRHAKPPMQALTLALCCMRAMEKAVDSFDFMQSGEPFSHRLNWALRQATARYLSR